MQIELGCDYRFEAALRLVDAPTAHPAGRLHGHSYRARLLFSGVVDEARGWLLDRREIDRVAAPLIEQLDHRLLNDIDGLANPTTERLCAWLWQRLRPALPELVAVTVWETDAVRCTYRGPR